jgi:ribose transport system substrate-binding protein
MAHMSQPAHPHRLAARCAATAAVALSALAVAACGSSSSSSADGSSNSSAAGTPAASTSSGDLAALRADLKAHSGLVSSYPKVSPIPHGVSSLKGKTVWWVPIGASIPTLAAMGNAMQSALARVGIKLQTCDGKLLPTAIAACLSQAASEGAAGVVTGFVDYASMPNSFNNLVAHHIPVLVAGEQPDGGKTSTTQLAFYTTRVADDEMQRLDLESTITNSDGKAKILYIGVTDSPETKHQAAYAKAFTAQHCPGCSFTEIDYDTAAINKLASAVSAALLSNPDTTDVVCEVDACEPFATQGIQTAGYTNKVKLFSANGNLSSLQELKSGSLLTADVGISATYYGWLFSDGILRLMTGSLPTPTTTVERVFTKSNVAGLTLTPAAYATEAWYGSNAFEPQFLNAWAGK